MVLRLGNPARGEEPVAAVDSDDKLLTAESSLDQLYGMGFEFEAAVSQAALLEAMTLSYLASRRSSPAVKVKKMTFGEAVKEMIRFDFFTEGIAGPGTSQAELDAVRADLEQYVLYRNDLAHNLLAMFKKLDLEQEYARGKRLMRFMHRDLFGLVEAAGRIQAGEGSADF